MVVCETLINTSSAPSNQFSVVKNWAQEEEISETFAPRLVIRPCASGFSWSRRLWWVVRAFLLHLLCFGVSFFALSVVLTSTNIPRFWSFVLSQGPFFLAVSPDSPPSPFSKELSSNLAFLKELFPKLFSQEVHNTLSLTNIQIPPASSVMCAHADSGAHRNTIFNSTGAILHTDEAADTSKTPARTWWIPPPLLLSLLDITNPGAKPAGLILLLQHSNHALEQ